MTVRVLSRRRRHLRALLYAMAACGVLIGGAWMGAAMGGSPFSWLLPILGLCGYGFFASLAMLLWQGRRTKPRPPRGRMRSQGSAPRTGTSASPGSGFRRIPQ